LSFAYPLPTNFNVKTSRPAFAGRLFLGEA
jgi:hypothetical protein